MSKENAGLNAPKGGAHEIEWLAFTSVTTAWPPAMKAADVLYNALTKAPDQVGAALKGFETALHETEGAVEKMGGAEQFPMHNASEIIAEVQAGHYEAAAKAIEHFTGWAEGVNDTLQFMSHFQILG